MVIVLSSIGCLSTSSVSLGNSVSSSIKSIPLWASETSHGLNADHHQMMDILEAVWWIGRNGLWTTSGVYLSNLPTTEYICETSSISWWLSGGRIDWIALANSVLPLHGDHTIKILCSHAAAIHIALFATGCHLISPKSFSRSLSLIKLSSDLCWFWQEGCLLWIK